MQGMDISPKLQKSDVIIARPGSIEEYQRIPATMLGWGFLPEAERRGVAPREEWKRRVEEVHLCGMKFQGRVEFDADWRGMIDFDSNFMESVCLDLDERPIFTWWTFKYKGHYPYYYCTNSEGYLRYLKFQIKEVLACGADMLMLDCAIPTMGALYKGGCFCETCMDGFRAYLLDTLSEEGWEQWGVKDPQTFDYRVYLLDAGWDVVKWGRNILPGNDVTPQAPYQMRLFNEEGQIDWQRVDSSVDISYSRELPPLSREYLRFQYGKGEELFKTLRTYAEEQAGGWISVSVNEPFHRPYRLFSLPYVDFYTKELIHYKKGQENTIPAEPILAYKLCEAFGTMIAGIGIPGDYKPVEELGLHRLVHYWIALAYAHGHIQLAPLRMWTDRLKNTADSWYLSKSDDYTEIFQFIRDNAALFNEYDSLATTVVVLSYEDICEPLVDFYELCTTLTELNVPYTFVLGASDLLEKESLTSERLETFETILIHKDTKLNAPQKALLDACGEKVSSFENSAELGGLVESPFNIDGAANITVVPRQKMPGGDTILHLINRNYIPENNAVEEQNFTLSVRANLFTQNITQAIFTAPGKKSQAVPCEMKDNKLVLQIKNLSTWGIVILTS